MSYELQIPDYLTESADDIHARMIKEAPKGINTVEGDICFGIILVHLQKN